MSEPDPDEYTFIVRDARGQHVRVTVKGEDVRRLREATKAAEQAIIESVRLWLGRIGGDTPFAAMPGEFATGGLLGDRTIAGTPVHIGLDFPRSEAMAPADDPNTWKVVNPPGVGQRVDVTFRPMIGGDDGYFAKVAAKMREDIARAFSGAAPKARFMVRRGTCPGCGVYVEPGGSCQCTA